MRGFVALHGRRVLEHPLRTVLSVTGIGSACALLVAVLALSASLTGSIGRSAALAGRADVQISGVSDTGFDESLFLAIQQTPGASAVVPYVQTPAEVGGVRAVLLGFDERALALGRSGDAKLKAQLSGPHADANGVFVGSELARLTREHPGSDVTVTVGGQPSATRTLGVLPPGPLGQFNSGVVLVAPLPVAQQLAGRPHRLDGIYVVAAPGVAVAELQRRVAETIGDRAAVSSPRLLADQARAEAAALRAGLLTVSALALMVAGLVVFNTMNMAALERRRELATLRALGSRRRPLLVGFVAQAAIVGLAGSAVGAAAGFALARGLVSRLPNNLVASFDLRIDFIFPWATVPLVLLIGSGLAVMAAIAPARRVVRTSPVEAMRPEGVLESQERSNHVHWPAATGGLAALTAGLGLSFAAGGSAAVLATALFWGGATLATFGFAAPLAEAAGWLTSRFGTPGRLACASLARAPRRVFITASAVAAAVALMVAQTGTERNVARSLRQSLDALAHTDVVVTTRTPDSLAADQLLPGQLGQQLSQLPGVGAAALGQDAWATIDGARVMLRGVAGDSAIPELRLAPEDARRRVLDGTGAVVTTQFSLQQHRSRGDTVQLSTPTGAQQLPIVAVLDTFGSPSGAVILSLGELQTWFNRPGLTRIELTATPSTDPFALRRTAIAAVGGVGRVESGHDAVDRLEGASRQITAAFDAIELIVIIGAALALLNTLTISMVERRRELGILRAVGTSRRQLRRSVLIEAIGIGALGACIGVVGGGFSHRLAVLATRQVGGLPVTYHFDPTPIALASIAAIVLTMAGAYPPARRSGRLDVIHAIGYE